MKRKQYYVVVRCNAEGVAIDGLWGVAIICGTLDDANRQKQSREADNANGETWKVIAGIKSNYAE